MARKHPRKSTGKSSRKAKKDTKKTEPKRGRHESSSMADEIKGLALLALALLTGLSLISLQFGTGRLMGPFGRAVAFGMFAVVGTAAHLLVVALGVAAIRMMVGGSRNPDWATIVGYAGSILMSAVIFSVAIPEYRLAGLPAGGALGSAVANVMLQLLSRAGTYLVAGATGLGFLMIATHISLVEASSWSYRTFKEAGRYAARALAATWRVLTQTFSWTPDVVASGDQAALTGIPGMAEPSTQHPAFAGSDGTFDEEDVPQPNDDRLRNEEPATPRIVEHHHPKETKSRPKPPKPERQGPFELPSLDLLVDPPQENDSDSREDMIALATKLTGALSDYGVKGKVQEIHPGPVVTLYEVKPESGTKMSKFENLAKDLAMVMEAPRVRIIAPIPGKAAVGIEMPNRRRQTVYLRELLEDPAYSSGKPKLRMALGKDIFGATVTCDLAEAPHLLIAGTTGAGKSVGVHAMLLSLLYQYDPQRLKLLLIDPKMLEFSKYRDLPHLIHPVVTDARQANRALQWAVREMENRYQKLADMRVQNIENYNRKVKKIQAGEIEWDQDRDPEPMPYQVMVIDEFADLMMTAAKEVEISVARIAQKARAAGIHLIVATQRPSANVITGIIKANFPTRIAYRVSSKVDSRVVLDSPGAEALLGKGDMLYSDRGLAPRRVHGPFVSNDEIDAVCQHLKEQAQPVYVQEVVAPQESDGETGSEKNRDPLFDKAMDLVLTKKVSSTSKLQRIMSIGYNRAARLMDQLEEAGVVSAPEGPQGRRRVIATLADL